MAATDKAAGMAATDKAAGMERTAATGMERSAATRMAADAATWVEATARAGTTGVCSTKATDTNPDPTAADATAAALCSSLSRFYTDLVSPGLLRQLVQT